MTTSDETRRARAVRPAATAAATFLVVASLALPGVGAAAAEPQDNWSGIWNTQHKFGTPVLDLTFKKQKGDDQVKGTYTNSDGTTGKINGEIDLDGGHEVWSGRFRDDNGASKGKFRIKLKSDKVSFKGWFKTCGNFICSDKYDWTGEHA